MINKSKLAVIAVLAAMSIASPALAQSFNKSYGSGNVAPNPGGAASSQNGEVAASRNNAGKIAAQPSHAGKVASHHTGRAKFAGPGAQHRVQ